MTGDGPCLPNRRLQAPTTTSGHAMWARRSSGRLRIISQPSSPTVGLPRPALPLQQSAPTDLDRTSPESLYGLHLVGGGRHPAYDERGLMWRPLSRASGTAHEWWAPFRAGMRYWLRSVYIPTAPTMAASSASMCSPRIFPNPSCRRLPLPRARQSGCASLSTPAHGRLGSGNRDRKGRRGRRELYRLLGFPPDASPSMEEIRERLSGRAGTHPRHCHGGSCTRRTAYRNGAADRLARRVTHWLCSVPNSRTSRTAFRIGPSGLRSTSRR